MVACITCSCSDPAFSSEFCFHDLSCKMMAAYTSSRAPGANRWAACTQPGESSNRKDLPMTDFSELNHYFQELEEKDAFSGVVLITQGNLQVYAGSYGYASRPWRIKNSLEIRFDTASITKLFTAVAVLKSPTGRKSCISGKPSAILLTDS